MSCRRAAFRAGCALSALALLSACGGGGSGGVNSTPLPPPPVPPSPQPTPPPPPPPGNFDTAEYRRSNGAVQASAISAYGAGATGAGVIAAVIDSGVAQFNSEFTGRIHPASADLAGARGIGDEGGHGTAVSDVLLGAKNDNGIHGVAFGATLLVARTDTPGSCANTDPDEGCMHDDVAIARGVDLAVANNARVINISLGGSPPNSILRAAIARATAAGVVIVFSAGNDSSNDPDPLAQIANDPLARNMIVIAGALDASGAALASFSNKAGNGAVHYLGALGVSVRAIDHTGTSFLWSGTSFAAPIISGAIALLAQAFPNLTGAQIIDLLLRSATDLGAPGVDATFGHGAIDLATAFAPQGQMTFAGSAVPLPATTGQTSAPMGDAGKTGLAAVVLDSYGRAYSADLSQGLMRQPFQPRLAPALGVGSRSLGMESGAVAIALSVSEGGTEARASRLLLSPADERRARALAGSVVTRLGPDTALALGISRSGLALAREMTGRGGGDFLLGSGAGTDFGFDMRARSGVAMRQRFGGFDFTASAETGVARLWDREAFAELRRGYRNHDYALFSLGIGRSFGALDLAARATELDERDTVLGARFDRTLAGKGARSWFADLEARWTPARNWTLGAAWRQGWTRLAAGGLRRGADHLRTSGWSVEMTRGALFTPRDRFSLRLAQPLRVSAGGFDLDLASSYDYATRSAGISTMRLNLAPAGRERDVEAAYSKPLRGGWISANAYWRHEPGNFAAAPDDLGAAIRFSFGI